MIRVFFFQIKIMKLIKRVIYFLDVFVVQVIKEHVSMFNILVSSLT